ncbi:MAG: intermembrane phospholipid transport protein YdbH family protein [Arenicellales bacterium]
MRIISKIVLSLLSVFVVASMLWVAGPYLLEKVVQQQLQQQGFTDIEVSIGHIGLSRATVDHLQMSNDAYLLMLKNLQANYSLSGLLKGSADSIVVAQISLQRLAAEQAAAALPDPVMLLGLMNTPWQEFVPARLITVKELALVEENGVPSLVASLNVKKQAGGMITEVKMTDSAGENHRFNFVMSPEAGVSLRWMATDEGMNEARLNEARQPPFTLNLLPAQGSNELAGLAGRIEADLSKLADIFSPLRGSTGLFKADISYSARLDSPIKDFSVVAELENGQFMGAQVKKIIAAIEGNVENTDGVYTVNFKEPSVVTLDTLGLDDKNIGKAAIRLPRVLEVVDGGVTIHDGSGASIRLSNLWMENISIPTMRLENIALSGRRQAENSEACHITSKITAPLIRVNDFHIKNDVLQLTADCADDEAQPGTVNIQANELSIEDNDFLLPLNLCSLNLKNVDDKSADWSAEVQGDFSCQSSVMSSPLTSRFQFNLEKTAGSAHYSFSEIKPDSDNPLFSSILKGWNEPYDIVSGTLSASGEYRWWTSSRGLYRDKLDLNLNVSDAGGFYDGVLFSGLNYSDTIDLLPVIKSSDFALMKVDDVDIGIPVTEVSAKIRFKATRNGPLPILIVNALSLSLLDGRVKGNDLEIDLNNDAHDLVLVVVGLDLAQIVALQQLEGLTATGRLDGYIPVTITENGMKITEGRIVSQKSGGKINYLPAGGTAEMEKAAMGSEFVFRIIKDLNYNSLEIDVNYGESGEMEMRLAIKGKSPKLDERRPIHFNLNLQQNVLKLLQGLRYAEGLSEEIDNNVQKSFRSRRNSVN